MLESNLLMNSRIPSQSHRTSGAPSHLCRDKEGLTSCNMQYMQLSIYSEFFLFGHLIRACGRQPWITLCFNCYANFILIICQCLWLDSTIKQINSWVIDVILETGQCLVTFTSPHAITNKEASLRSLFTKQGQSKFIPLNCLNPRVFSM